MNIWNTVKRVFPWGKRKKPKKPDPKGDGKRKSTSTEKEKTSSPPVEPPRRVDEERLSGIILGARMSEKSVRLSERQQHVFVVRPDATREEVKLAVEHLLEVKVSSVRMANVRGKAKRNGSRDDWSKAYVRLEAGQSLENVEIGA